MAIHLHHHLSLVGSQEGTIAAECTLDQTTPSSEIGSDSLKEESAAAMVLKVLGEEMASYLQAELPLVLDLILLDLLVLGLASLVVEDLEEDLNLEEVEGVGIQIGMSYDHLEGAVITTTCSCDG